MTKRYNKKKHTKKRTSRARGISSDLVNMEEGRAKTKHLVPVPVPVPFHRVSPKNTAAMPAATSVLPRPEGFDSNALDEAALRKAESKMKKPSTTPPKLARIPTPEFFDHPPPEEREGLRRAASAELKEANARMEAEQSVERNKLVVPEKKGWWARGKKSIKRPKGKKRKGTKSKKHSTRRK
jgi:hypothetical protein